jgi:hypothetical protein
MDTFSPRRLPADGNISAAAVALSPAVDTDQPGHQQNLPWIGTAPLAVAPTASFVQTQAERNASVVGSQAVPGTSGD